MGVQGSRKIRDFDAAAEAPGRIADGIVLKDDQAVEQPMPPGHFAEALDLHEGSELEGAQLQRPGLQPAQIIAHDRIRTDGNADRQIVDEGTDDGFDAGQVRRPGGECRADDHVRSAALAAQQKPPSALHKRAQSDLQPAGGGLQLAGRLRREGQPDLQVAFAVGSRVGGVMRQRSGLPEAGQGRAPKLPRFIERMCAQPTDVIAVRPDGLERRRVLAGVSFVEPADILKDHRPGPPVKQEGRDAPEELPCLVVPADEGEAHHRRFGQHQRAGAILFQKAGPALGPLRGRFLPPILDGPNRLDLSVDDLNRFRQPLVVDRRPQDGMPLQRFPPGFLKSLRIQFAAQSAMPLVERGLYGARVRRVEEHLNRGKRVNVLDVAPASQQAVQRRLAQSRQRKIRRRASAHAG